MNTGPGEREEAPSSKPYKEHLRETLKTPDDYRGYLDACHAEGPKTFALGVQDVTHLAATRMRERCVDHLRATADALDVRQETECPSGTGFNSEAILRRRIATELESLTLDEEKEQ